MAIFCELHVPRGTRAQSIALEQQVEQRLHAAGGPPDGLMFLCVHPDGDGFRIVMVFRSSETALEENGRLRADAAAVGIDLGELSTSPVWGMALPGAH